MTYVTNKSRKLLNDGKVALGVTVKTGSPEKCRNRLGTWAIIGCGSMPSTARWI